MVERRFRSFMPNIKPPLRPSDASGKVKMTSKAELQERVCPRRHFYGVDLAKLIHPLGSSREFIRDWMVCPAKLSDRPISDTPGDCSVVTWRVPGESLDAYIRRNDETHKLLKRLNELFDGPKEFKRLVTRTYWLAHKAGGRANSYWGESAESKARSCYKSIAVTGPHTITFTEGDGL